MTTPVLDITALEASALLWASRREADTGGTFTKADMIAAFMGGAYLAADNVTDFPESERWRCLKQDGGDRRGAR